MINELILLNLNLDQRVSRTWTIVSIYNGNIKPILSRRPPSSIPKVHLPTKHTSVVLKSLKTQAYFLEFYRPEAYQRIKLHGRYLQVLDNEFVGFYIVDFLTWCLSLQACHLSHDVFLKTPCGHLQFCHLMLNIIGNLSIKVSLLISLDIKRKIALTLLLPILEVWNWLFYQININIAGV